MKTDFLYRAMRAIVIFLMGVFVSGCFLLGDPDVDPEKDPDSLRAYSEETATSTVKMSESTVFIKGDVSHDLQGFDPESGTITFANSDLLKHQEIKPGDILYSTDRTELTPDGYCLRVVSVYESGGTVTYETEPATALEAIDYLNETGVLSAGNYKPEDIRVFAIPEDDESPGTRGFTSDGSVEIKGDKMDFYSDEKTTRFGYILFEDKDHTDDLKSSLKIKVSLEFQHEIDSDKSNIMFDYGKFVLFTMFKVGVNVKFEIGTSLALQGNQDSLLSKEQEKIAKERLVGKKFKIAEIPLDFTCAKVVVNPKFIVYGEFKLDLSGKLVLETGIKDGYYALNVENKGYFIPEFIEYSYLRKITHFHPNVHMEGTLGFTAMAGFGVGINFELPTFPIIKRDEGNIDSKVTEPSAVGVYFGAEMTEDIDVVAEADFFSGNREFRIEGKNGGLKLKASIEGKIGIRKKVFAELDWTFWENEMITLPDWSWKIYTWTPKPYDLESVVNNDHGTVALSWKIPDRNGIFNTSAVNIGAATSGKVVLSPVASQLENPSYTFGPAADGTYYWNVTTLAVDGGMFPSDTLSFVINASKVTTGVPEKSGNTVTVPVEINSLNNILERGVVYSTEHREPLADVDVESHYSGTEKVFNQKITGLDPTKTYYLRGYALISVDGGSRYVYGNVEELTSQNTPVSFTVSPSEIDFGRVEYGTDKTAKFSVTNTGKGILKFNIACECHDNVFEVEGGDEQTLAAGATKVFTVTAHGMKRNSSASCDVRVLPASGEGSQTIKVQAEGWDNRPLTLETTSKTMKVGDKDQVNVIFGSLDYEIANENPAIVNAMLGTQGDSGGGWYDTWSYTYKFVGLEALAPGTATIKVFDKERNEEVTLVVTVTGSGSAFAVPGAVDLGLPSGLKWASFNLGASKPEEYGDYYAWGETEPYYSSQDPLTWKEGKGGGYRWSSYKWCMGEYDTLTKYCSNSRDGYNGFTDNKTVLDLEDDAAHVNLGGPWRMPTDAEWTELREKCTWTWTTQNGVNGYLVSASNGNSIFLPAAGYRRDTDLYRVGSRGDYWSSSLSTDYPNYAWYVLIDSGGVSRYDGLRYRGLSVRPVSE